MKNLFIIYLAFFPLLLQAQSFFNQKKTKLKYIAQQIALFKVYAGYLKQGYDIAEKGWSAINDIKHGDFDLHNNYFDALKKVNNNIGEYAEADSIENIRLEIVHIDHNITGFIQDNENIRAEEKDYINKVMSNLLEECAADMDKLSMLTTDSVVSMKDDERLESIDGIYTGMKDKYSFARHFQNTVKLLALSRARDANDINAVKLMYGIK